MKQFLYFIFVCFICVACQDNNSSEGLSDTINDQLSGECKSIIDCSDKETKEAVCIKKACVKLGDEKGMLHIVFYPKYISSVVDSIVYLKYFYFYSLDTSGNSITCEKLLSNYDFENRVELNLIQSYEKQATISSTGAEMYTLPLPLIKDSLIFFQFYQDNGSVVAIGCADKIDTTSGNSIGIFPCKPDQINACLGQF